MDGGSVTAPRVALWAPEGDYAVENKGGAPDIDVTRQHPRGDDGDRRGGGTEPEPVRLLRPSDPAGGGAEEEEQQRDGMQVRIEARARREVEREGEGE